MRSGERGPNDPERASRVLDATIEVVGELGIAAATHRRVAERCGVPLGSVTYYFESRDALLIQAFRRLADRIAERYEAAFGAADSVSDARTVVVEIIASETFIGRHELRALHEMYALASRQPEARTVIQRWMGRSRTALETHFDPGQAQALDALIEGWSIHRGFADIPVDRANVGAAVDSLTRAPRGSDCPDQQDR